METKKHITIDSDTIDKFSNDFLESNISNPFYDKNIFFTQGLRTTKYIEFQIIGNLGGHPDDIEFNAATDYYVIADSLLEDMVKGLKDSQLQELEKKINSKGKKHEKLTIISEAAFLKHIKKRCDEIGDNVTLNLITQVP
jgi:hypothetical protein